MFSDEEMVVRAGTWKKVSPALIAHRFSLSREEGERVFKLLERSGQEKEVVGREMHTPSSYTRPPDKTSSSFLQLGIWILSFLLFCNLVGLGYLYRHDKGTESIEWSKSAYKGAFCEGGGNVALIHITGELVTYPLTASKEETFTSADQVLLSLKRAADDPLIIGIVLVIDSYGGSAVAAEEISQFIRSIEKPTVSLVRGQGLSAGYWVAAGAEHVIASTLSDVGSIGVTASYIEYSKQNEEEGLTFVELSSGRFKDAGNPDKPLTKEEEELFLRDIEKMHAIFVSQISSLRSLSVEKVSAIADGSSVLGEEALSLGLIDQTGGWQEVFTWLSQKTDKKPVLCKDDISHDSY